MIPVQITVGKPIPTRASALRAYIGKLILMRTPKGPYKVVCPMVLNNVTWRDVWWRLPGEPQNGPGSQYILHNWQWFEPIVRVQLDPLPVDPHRPVIWGFDSSRLDTPTIVSWGLSTDGALVRGFDPNFMTTQLILDTVEDDEI